MNEAQKINTHVPDSIGKYRILSKLGEGATSEVFLGEHEGTKVAVKLMRTDVREDVTSAGLRFRRESNALLSLNHPNIVRCLDAGEYNKIPFMCLEVLNGQELEDSLAGGKVLSEMRVLKVAEHVAEGLAAVHRKGYVHRDLKPANIYILDDETAKIIDFGFVDLGESLGDAGEDEEKEAIGTFKYAPPEQSGVRKGKVDGRSDLYSLGIVMYECATGQAPFMQSDMGALLAAHKSEIPPPVKTKNPAISEALSQIIDKLIAKNPDDRYQTAEGLIDDIKKIEQLNKSFQETGKISLGESDFQLGKLNEIPLIGRESELESMAKNVASDAKGSALLVKGEPGSGKSYLIKAFISENKVENQLVIQGKCQIRDQVPLAPLKEAMDNMISSYLRKGDDEQKEMFDVIRVAAQSIEPYVCRLSSSLNQILDFDVSKATVSQDKEVFFSNVAKFFTSLSDKFSRMVMYIDDIQWLDDASFGVLSKILASIDDSKLVMLCSARSNEEYEESVNKFVEAGHGKFAEIIRLAPLKAESLEEIISFQLKGSKLEGSVVEKIVGKSNGNPFAVIQYIYAMKDNGILLKSGSRFTVDTDKLESMILSADVIQLVISRIGSLAETTLQVLRVGALFGNTFSIDMLSKVLKQDKSEADSKIAEAIQANLIQSDQDENLQFVHDRVREAVLEDLKEEDRKDLHYEIAIALDQEKNPDIYLLATHFANGHPERAPERVYNTNLLAGREASSNYAIKESLEFLHNAEVAEESIKDTKEINPANLREEIGGAYVKLGKPGDAITYLNKSLELSDNRNQKGRVHSMLARTYIYENRGLDAWKEIENGLNILGEGLRKNKIAVALFAFIDWIRSTLIYKFKVGMGSPSDEQKERHKTLVELMSAGWFSSFISLRWPISKQIVPKLLFHTCKIDGTPTCVEGYSTLAFHYGAAGFWKKSKKIGDHAVNLAEAFGIKQMIALAKMRMGLGLSWGGRPIEAYEVERNALLTYASWVPPRWHIVPTNDLVGVNLLVRGFAKEALPFALKSLERAEATKSPSVIGVSQCVLLGCYSLLGYQEERVKLKGKIKSTYENIDENRLDWTWQIAHSLLDKFENRESYHDLPRIYQHFKKLSVPTDFSPFWFKVSYLYLAKLLSQAYEMEESIGARKSIHKQLLRSLKELKLAAFKLPHWHAQRLLILAKLAFSNNKILFSKYYLWKASKLADAAVSPLSNFDICVLRANICKRKGQKKQMMEYALKAQKIAVEHGWATRIDNLRGNFPFEEYERAQSHEKDVGKSLDAEKIEQQLKIMVRVSEAAAQSNEPIELARNVLQEFIELFKIDKAFVLEWDKPSSKLVPMVGVDAKGNMIEELKSFSTTIMNKACEERKTVILTVDDDGTQVNQSESIVLNQLSTIIATPIIFKDNLLGAVYMDCQSLSRSFDEEDRSLIEAVVSHFAAFMELARGAERMQSLLKVSLTMSASRDAKEQYRVALMEILRLIGAERSFLFFAEDDSNILVPGYGFSHDGNEIASLSGYSQSIIDKVVESREIQVHSGAEGEGSESVVAFGLRSTLAAPLMVNEKLIGVLYLDSQISKTIFKKEDMQLLKSIMGHISIAFETFRMTQMEFEKIEIEKGLELTGVIQNLLLPEKTFIRKGPIEVQAYFEPAEKSGGDWWYHHYDDMGRHIVVLGDVTGHGVASAMITAIVAGIYKTLNTISLQGLNDINEKLSQLNKIIHGMIVGKYWIAFSLLRIDPKEKLVEWWSAGAPPIFTVNYKKEPIKTKAVSARGNPLGFQENFDIVKKEFPFEDGAGFLVFTDGIYEIETEKGMLGLKGASKLFTEKIAANKSESTRFADDFSETIRDLRLKVDDDTTFIYISYDESRK